MSAMSADERSPAELLRRYYRALDTQNLDIIEDIFSADADWSMPGRRYSGAAALRKGNAETLARGVRTEHHFLHLVEGDGVALAEVLGKSRIGEREIVMKGAVVVEVKEGKISRFCIYPEPTDYAAYSAAREAAKK
jgi:ketosteroid isomerase-like protein